MKNKKTKLILLVLLGVFICSFSNLFIQDNNKNNDTRLLKTNDYDDESAGILIAGATENVFSICQGYEHSYLYFYNTSLDGSLYRIDLDNYLFTPTLIRGNLGNVYDIDSAYAPYGDMIFFATSEYDNAIMKMNVSLLVYEKILSSAWTPLKLSVDYDYRFESMIIVWITASNVFYWNNVDQIIENIETDFFNVIDIQCDWNDILYYNDEEIVLYDAWEFANPHEIARINDAGITSAFLDESREYIIYSQDDDPSSSIKDGKVIQFDYSDFSVTTIQSGIDYPVSVWCTGNYIYWLEKAYWSSRSMIYRYSYYYDSPDIHYYSKVSRAHGVSWADRIEFENDFNQNQLGVYWGYNQLYVINSSDITPPDTIEWMGSLDIISDYDYWDITWWNSWDLNEIKEYELIMSKTENFSTYDTFLIQESELSYTSFDFLDMEYGNYYYKIRAIDNIDRVNENYPNIGEWSDILHVSYLEPESEQLLPEISGYSILLIGLAIVIVTLLLIIKSKRKNI